MQEAPASCGKGSARGPGPPSPPSPIFEPFSPPASDNPYPSPTVSTALSKIPTRYNLPRIKSVVEITKKPIKNLKGQVKMSSNPPRSGSLESHPRQEAMDIDLVDKENLSPNTSRLPISKGHEFLHNPVAMENPESSLGQKDKENSPLDSAVNAVHTGISDLKRPLEIDGESVPLEHLSSKSLKTSASNIVANEAVSKSPSHSFTKSRYSSTDLAICRPYSSCR